jgi:NADPH-dependent 2,4-dienoyl-CoA reductase/sulfur reductase-like enzyme
MRWALLTDAFPILCLIPTILASPLQKRGTHECAQCTCVSSAGNAKDLFLRELLQQSPEYGNFEHTPTQGPLKVGIVGAGAAGLYAAILLESLDIDYEILEGSNRTGGRIFTHRFDQAAWAASRPGEPDYYNYYVCFGQSLTEYSNKGDRMLGLCVSQA